MTLPNPQKVCSILFPAGVLLFAAPGLTAQVDREVRSGSALGLRIEAVPADAPVVRATYDVSQGRIVNRDEAVAPNLALLRDGVPQTACFENYGFGPFSVFEAFDEIVDWGQKSCGASRWVSQITLGYRTSELDPSLGGPGATLEIAVYEGTSGFNNLGVELGRYTLTGLPGIFNPDLDSAFQPTFHVTLDLGPEPLFLPDGPIGWGYSRIADSTGPLMVAVNTASAEDGVEDALDVYRPGPATAGNYEGTFNFGAGCPCGSFFLGLTEYVGFPGAASSPIGPLSIAILRSDLPRFGRTWRPFVATTLVSGYSGSLLAISSAPEVPGTATPFGNALVDFGQLLRPLHFSSNGVHEFLLPTDPVLLGDDFYVQAITFGSNGPQLTNAYGMRFGF